jgi:hypothetical protein
MDVPSKYTIVEGEAGKAQGKKKRKGKLHRGGVVQTDQSAAVQ